MNVIWIKLPDRPAWSSPPDVLLSDGEVVESNLGVIERQELLGQYLVLGQVAEASVVHTKVDHLHTIMAAEISAAFTVHHVEDTFSVGPSGTLTKFASSCTLSSGWSLGRHVGNLTTLVAHDSLKMEEAHSESGTLAACQLVPLFGVEHLAVSLCHPPPNPARTVEITWYFIGPHRWFQSLVGPAFRPVNKFLFHSVKHIENQCKSVTPLEVVVTTSLESLPHFERGPVG